MKLEHRIGNLLEQSDIDVIIHQVNCKGVMGSGIAKQIRAKYPEAYRVYINGKMRLSNYTFADCYDNKRIVNIYGQKSYGTNVKHTNYVALISGIYNYLKEQEDPNIHRNDFKIGIPHSIGCGLGGGDWNIVLALLKDLCEMFDDNLTVVICEYKG